MITKEFVYKLERICPILVLLLILNIGCTDHFDALNTPDDRLSTANLNASNLGQALARAQNSAIRGDFQKKQSISSDYWSQYFASTQPNFFSDQFQNNDSWWQDVWAIDYLQTMPPLHFLIEIAKQDGLDEHYAIGKIWRVFHKHRVSDYWGPIIYSEYGSSGSVVHYDSQEDIYMSFFDELDEAIEILKNTSSSNVFGTNDLIYDGDVHKWIKFANSLRLRLAMRIVYADESKARQEAEKAVNEFAGVIETNADNAYLTTVDLSGSDNYYPVIVGWGEFRMSAAMESVLSGYEDPRMEVYFNEAEQGGYRGLRNGIEDSDRIQTIQNPIHSEMNDYWGSPDNPETPFPVLRAAEVNFLRAEGALRGWNMGGSAEAFYHDGIRQSMMEHPHANISSSQIESYLFSTNTPVALDDKWNSPALSDIPVLFDGSNFERSLEQIITQKWIALYPDGYEAWAEYRRTQYPRLYPLIHSTNPDVGRHDILRRVRYPSSEYNTNNEAVLEAIELLGGPDQNDTRLWWDQRSDRP